MLKVLFKPYFFEVLTILIISIITLTPYLQNLISPQFKMLFYIIGVALLFYRTPRLYAKQIRPIVFFGSFFILLIVLYLLLHISEGKITTAVYSQILITLPIIIFAWVYSRMSSKQIKYLFHSVLIIFSLNILDSIRLSIIYPVLTYQIALGLLEEEGIYGLNLGGTSFLTSCVIFINIVFFSYNITKSKREKVFYLIYLIIALWFIIFYSYKASVILLALVSLVLHFIIHSFRKSSILRIFAIVLIVSLVFFYRELLYFMTTIIGSERITERLLFFVYDEYKDEGSFNERYDLWMVSLNSWLRSISTFIWGIGEHPKVNDYTELSGIGRHSDVLDTLARYGIVGFFFIYMMFDKFFKYLKNVSGHFFNNEINVIIIIVVIISTTKRILYPDLGYCIFFLLPLCMRSCYLNRT